MQEAAGHLLRMVGAANTAVLLTSSLTMALAVHAARAANRRAAMLLLGATAGLGIAFLAVKGWEWHHEYGEGLWPAGGPRIPHGIGAGGAFLQPLLRRDGGCISCTSPWPSWGPWGRWRRIGAWPAAGRALGAVDWVGEGLGLYWHFVDIVWIFVFPVFYLM